MTSKMTSPAISAQDLRKELRLLYERRSVVETLIQSLEQYARAPKLGAGGAHVAPATDYWVEKLVS